VENPYLDGPFRRIGVVDNRVFPHEWATPASENDPSCLVTFGVHPSQVDNVDWAVVQENFEKFPVVGECGLDLVRGPEKHEAQEQLFRKHIRVALSSNKPLVLHLRGDISVIQRAQAILQEEMVPTLHRLYIHCYLGDMEEHETWISFFQRTIFGVSPITVITPVV
jgi:TatD DNase family protein